MTSPRISVIMAVHNGAADLLTSVPSVLEQDFGDFEFVIVDDGSTDTTPETIGGFRDPRILYHRNETNLGQTASLNVALRLARGEWIARIDADDRYLPGKLSRQMSFLERHPNVDVLGTWARRVDVEGGTIGGFYPPVHHRDIEYHLTHGSPLCHVSVVMRRDAVLAVGGYDETYRYAADYKLWSDLDAKGYTFANVGEVLMEYRENENSFGKHDLLARASEEGASIIQENYARLTGETISRLEAKSIYLRTTPEAALSRWAKGYAFLQMVDGARTVYGRVPARLAVRLFLGAAWSMARGEGPERPEEYLSAESLRRVESSLAVRAARLCSRTARRVHYDRLAVLKDRISEWGYSRGG